MYCCNVHFAASYIYVCYGLWTVWCVYIHDYYLMNDDTCACIYHVCLYMQHMAVYYTCEQVQQNMIWMYRQEKNIYFHIKSDLMLRVVNHYSSCEERGIVDETEEQNCSKKGAQLYDHAH